MNTPSRQFINSGRVLESCTDTRKGQCHSGEIELYTSGTGGGDYMGFQSESGTSKCRRGTKAFCCTDNTFDDLTADCYWTGCSGSCKSDEVSVATAVNLKGKAIPQIPSSLGTIQVTR